MPEDDLFVDISRICYVVSCSLVLILLVLGCTVGTFSGNYENPRYWARPWILVSIICSYLIVYVSYFGENGCLKLKINMVCSVSARIAAVLLVSNILTSIYNPYILSGKRQFAVWIFLIMMSWLIGLLFLFVMLKSYTNMSHPHAVQTSSGFEDILTSTSVYKNPEQTTSLLDRLDMEFDSGLLNFESKSGQYDVYHVDVRANSSSVENENEYCYVDEKCDLFFIITSLVLLFFAVLTAISVCKNLLRPITRCFRSCHSPLSASQKLVSKWIKHQRLSSALFVELHSVLLCLHTACEFFNCPFLYEYVRDLYPTCFALSCFMLKDVRNAFLSICFCKGCRN